MRRKSPLREQVLQCISRFRDNRRFPIYRMLAYSWEPLNEGLTGKRIYAVAGIGSAVFAGTNEGTLPSQRKCLGARMPVETFKATQSSENEVFANVDSGFYRLNSEGWEQVPVEFLNAIHFSEGL